MIKKLISIYIIGLAAVQIFFAAFVFIRMELYGYALFSEPRDFIRHFELFGCLAILFAFIGLIVGYVYQKHKLSKT